MKKLLLSSLFLITTTSFAGLVHEKVDARVQFNIGSGLDRMRIVEKQDKTKFFYANKSIILSPSFSLQTDVYTSPEFNVYVGGKVTDSFYYGERFKKEMKKDSKVERVSDVISNEIKLEGIVGLTEEYMDIEFYQQLTAGFGEKLTYKIGDSSSIRNFAIMPISAEVGAKHNNVLLNAKLGTSIVLSKHKATAGEKHTELQSFDLSIGLGYEF